MTGYCHLRLSLALSALFMSSIRRYVLDKDSWHQPRMRTRLLAVDREIRGHQYIIIDRHMMNYYSFKLIDGRYRPQAPKFVELF